MPKRTRITRNCWTFIEEDLVNLEEYAGQERDKQSSGAKESGDSG